MKKRSWALVALLFFTINNVNSQTPAKTPVKTPAKPEPAKAIIKDTFVFKVLNTLNKIIGVVEDPKKHPMLLAGELIRTENNGAGVYQATIQMPGAIRSEFSLYATDRDKSISTWEWRTTLYKFARGQQTPMLETAVKKLDSISRSFEERRKLSGYRFEIYKSALIGLNYLDYEEVFLIVKLDGKVHNTEQESIDSILQLYRPLLSNKATAGDCGQKFARAFELEGIKQERIISIFTNLVKEIANSNVGAAFEMLVGGPHYIKVEEVVPHLTYSQQEEVKILARKKVDDFYAQYNKPANDVVVEKKKEIEKQKVPTDPCKKEIWELALKPGNYIEGNGLVGYITEYSCTTHTYTYVYVNATKKLIFEKNVPVSTMSAFSSSRSSPFIVCSHCRGVGYSMEYDWYQTNAYSGHYARSNKQTQYSCGECRGAGYIQVR